MYLQSLGNLIILGSIPSSAGTMVLWFSFSFPSGRNISRVEIFVYPYERPTNCAYLLLSFATSIC